MTTQVIFSLPSRCVGSINITTCVCAPLLLYIYVCVCLARAGCEIMFILLYEEAINNVAMRLLLADVASSVRDNV